MNFRQLEVFVGIVKHGSFTRAANALYLTQPTVSTHIDLLEEELGVLLFERQGREVLLTEAGRLFYPYAADILSLRDKVIDAVNRYKEQIAGSITVASSTTPGNYLLPRLIKPFCTEYADVRFKIAISNSAKVLDAVRDYQADIGLVGLTAKDKQLEFVPVCQDKMVVIASSAYPCSGGNKALSVAQIKAENLIIRSPGSATRQVLERALNEIGQSLSDLNVIMEVDSLEAIKNFVKYGAGISIVPSISVCPEEPLKVFSLAGLKICRTFYLVYHRKRVLSPAVKEFVKYVQEGLMTI